MKGKITFFLPLNEKLPEYWKSLANECQAIYVPGTHDTMFNEPYVKELANKLNTVLD